MVEASIAMPIIILAVMLLLRLFTFYLQILNTGIKEHEKALEEWDKFAGKSMRTYETTSDVEMVKGGLLGMDLHKMISTKAYFFNEDVLVRAGDVIDQE